jgi:hypothetical protein
VGLRWRLRGNAGTLNWLYWPVLLVELLVLVVLLLQGSDLSALPEWSKRSATTPNNSPISQ